MARVVAQYAFAFVYAIGTATTGMRYSDRAIHYGLQNNKKDWEMFTLIAMAIPVSLLWPVFYPIMEYNSRREKQ
jgi:hypothetical protein